ncbi:hypothetical protein [Vibrio sp. 10N]|uniref:hypothetical protein n=1 Tax=Vibrio sp. 10N TaxID=3058938 RepID=UPI0028146594|nr:hypothetical protein VB10N_46290 [Vibrio sp. 10N]
MQLKAHIEVCVTSLLFRLIESCSLVRYMHEFDKHTFLIDVQASRKIGSDMEEIVMLIAYHSEYDKSELVNCQFIHITKE